MVRCSASIIEYCKTLPIYKKPKLILNESLLRWSTKEELVPVLKEKELLRVLRLQAAAAAADHSPSVDVDVTSLDPENSADSTPLAPKEETDVFFKEPLAQPALPAPATAPAPPQDTKPPLLYP